MKDLIKSEIEGAEIRVAIYARTSSANQRYNFSITEQIAACQKYVSQRGWITKYVFKDECERAESTDREKFQIMLEKAEQGCFDVVIFWKIDRFCRSLQDLLNVEERLRKSGISLCSATEFVDTTSSVGRFNFRSIGSVAQLEAELISERARLGLNGLAKAHRWPNNHPPLGFVTTVHGRLKVFPKEIRVVRRIFRLYLKTKSMSNVACILNKAKIFTKKGLMWTASSVKAILTNEIYVGKYCVAAVQDYIQEYRVISDEVFSAASCVRMRYRKEENVCRPEMPADCKRAKTEKVIHQYLSILQQKG